MPRATGPGGEDPDLAQARKKSESGGPPAIARHVHRALREGAFVLLIAVSAYLLLSLLTFNTQDPGWSHTGIGSAVENAGGRAGAWFADVFLYLFGYIAYLIPPMVAWGGWLVYRGRPEAEQGALRFHVLRWGGFVVTLLAACGLATLHFVAASGSLPVGSNAGGVLGGLSTGQPVIARFAVKPTSSILTPRRTITKSGEETEIVTKGRHDPCVGIRAVPVAEAMAGTSSLPTPAPRPTKPR